MSEYRIVKDGVDYCIYEVEVSGNGEITDRNRSPVRLQACSKEDLLDLLAEIYETIQGTEVLEISSLDEDIWEEWIDEVEDVVSKISRGT